MTPSGGKGLENYLSIHDAYWGTRIRELPIRTCRILGGQGLEKGYSSISDKQPKKYKHSFSLFYSKSTLGPNLNV